MPISVALTIDTVETTSVADCLAACRLAFNGVSPILEYRGCAHKEGSCEVFYVAAGDTELTLLVAQIKRFNDAVSPGKQKIGLRARIDGQDQHLVIA